MGQRVALKFVNETPMSHPMHLHGHAFQVTEINGSLPGRGARYRAGPRQHERDCRL